MSDEQHADELTVYPRDLPPRQGARGARDLAQERRPERPRRRGGGAGVVTSSVNGTTGEFVVVHVRDAVNSILAGRGDVSYQSPPLPHGEAMKLVRMLLGRGEEFAFAEERWMCPIAGGQRTVTVRPVAGVAGA